MNNIVAIRNGLPVWLLALFVFFMPIWPKILPLFIILWVVSCFFITPFKLNLKSPLKSKSALVTLAFFFIHVACLLYTDNLKSGFFDVETKLSLLIYPIFMTNTFQLIKLKMNGILWMFVLGVFVASVSCLGHSFYLHFKYDASFQYFTYTDLSIFLHPAYFAMYLCFAIVALFTIFPTATSQMKFLIAVLIIFFCGVNYLLSSKSGLITLGVIIISGIFFYMKKKLSTYLVLGIVVIGIGILFMTNERFAYFQKVLVEQFNGNGEKPSIAESSSDRLNIWKTAFTVLEEKWVLGVGAGDVKYVLMENYSSSFEEGREKQLNAHNQFLETWLATGILGIALLIYMTISPFVMGIRKKDFLAIGFSLILLINFMVESVLNTQAGILFFAFFFILSSLRNEEVSTSFEK